MIAQPIQYTANNEEAQMAKKQLSSFTLAFHYKQVEQKTNKWEMIRPIKFKHSSNIKIVIQILI